jgi:hypothetical protein
LFKETTWQHRLKKNKTALVVKSSRKKEIFLMNSSHTMEIEIKQSLQDILDKLEVVEDKIKIPSRQFAQLEEDLNTTVEDEN